MSTPLSLAGRRVWLCDLDGTLVDSAPAHEAAFRDAIAELAPGLLESFRYAEHAGATTRDVVARLGVTGDLAERLVRRKQWLYRRYAEDGMVTVMPGAHRLLDRLAATGRTAYLVTSGSRASVTRVLAACALAGRLRDVLTADDVPWSKPDPRCYAHACRLWSVDPAEAVAVEDSAHGVASATGAGLTTLQLCAADPLPGAIGVRSLDEIVSLLDLETCRS
jgi:haloacid dehalogenase superfamily, subfamily IA, variant 3 with third motif having DD or ED